MNPAHRLYVPPQHLSRKLAVSTSVELSHPEWGAGLALRFISLLVTSMKSTRAVILQKRGPPLRVTGINLRADRKNEIGH
jgi:hypothetical protein